MQKLQIVFKQGCGFSCCHVLTFILSIHSDYYCLYCPEKKTKGKDIEGYVRIKGALWHWLFLNTNIHAGAKSSVLGFHYRQYLYAEQSLLYLTVPAADSVITFV